MSLLQHACWIFAVLTQTTQDFFFIISLCSCSWACIKSKPVLIPKWRDSTLSQDHQYQRKQPSNIQRSSSIKTKLNIGIMTTEGTTSDCFGFSLKREFYTFQNSPNMLEEKWGKEGLDSKHEIPQLKKLESQEEK